MSQTSEALTRPDSFNPRASASAAEIIAHGIRKPLAEPIVFEYRDLWQHERPLLDELRAAAGHIPLDRLGGTYGWSVRYKQREDYVGLGVETLADYIDAFRAGAKKLPYLRHISLNKSAPGLRRYIKDPVAFTPNWVTPRWLNRLGGPELFIGQEGTSFGHVHRDHANVHVGFVQLLGEKELVLFPPSDRDYVYCCQGREFPYQDRATMVRHADLQNFDEFPLLRHATPHKITLREGEALLMPANWWHTTYNHCNSISYSIRIINATNVAGCVGVHFAGIPRLVKRALFGRPQFPAKA
ncbi:MAG: cupin-like domain-containing protein [Gammaproteobacteria bacterium]|nr:cupin-like domain-containing protein [Gammaproteobacteria bacterium]